MLRTFKLIGVVLMCAVTLTAAPAYAVVAGPTALSVGGALYNPDGSPIRQNNVNFRLTIYDATGACALYTERHLNEDLSQTLGRFNLTLGQGTSITNNVSSSNALDLSVFNNPGSSTVAGCGSVNLNPGDGRQILVEYDLGGGFTQMTPTVAVQSSAYAMVADTLGGLAKSDFIQVADNGSSALNQTNTQYAFSSVNWPRLKALLDGTSSAYLPTSPTTSVDMNGQRVIDVQDPTAPQDAATKHYADANLGGSLLDLTAVGPMTGGGSTLLWDQTANKWVAGTLNTSPTGAAGGDLSGTYPNPTVGLQKVTLPKLNGGGSVNRLLISDATTGTGVVAGYCAIGEVYVWTATGFACTSGASLSPVQSVAGKTGAVTLNAADIGGLGTAALYDYGTAAGQIPRLDGSARMPAVDGSQLVNINATSLQTRAVANIAPATNQVLGWNGSAWTPMTANSGSVTSVAGGTGLLGGTITSSGTLSVDVGTTAGKIMQLNASAQAPAVDGSLLTNINATALQTRAVASTAPAAGQVLGWNATTTRWEPTSAAVGSVTSIATTNGILGGPITGTGTLSIDTGTAANKIMQLNASAQVPAVDGSLLNFINAVKLQSRTVASTAPNAGQVLAWNATSLQWEPTTSVTGTVTNIATGTGLLGGPVTNTGTISVDVGNTANKIVQENASAQIAQSTGSVSLPSYSFAGNTNTGLYSPGTNQLALTTNGTASVSVLANGNVGIGTNAPLQTLSVNGPILGVGAVASNARIQFGYNGNPNTAGLSYAGQDFLVFNSASVNLPGFANAPAFTVASGWVGIGTTAPQAGLDVTTTGTAASAIIIPRDTLTNRPTGINGMLRYNTSSNVFEGFANNVWSTIAAGSAAGTVTNIASGTGLLGGPITTSGTLSVDVGTAANKIVQENANAQIAQSTGSLATPAYSFAGNTNTGVYSPGANQLAIVSNGTAAMNVTANGYVGIGTAAPTSKVYIQDNQSADVRFDIENLNTTGGIATIGAKSGGYYNEWRGYSAGASQIQTNAATLAIAVNGTGSLQMVTNGAERVRITNWGGVGIGTNAPLAALDVSVIGTSSAILIPRDIASNRPAGVNGMLRYNTSSNVFEGFANNVWSTIAAGSAAGTITNIASGTGLLGGPITTTGTLSVDVGTAANKIVQENATAQIAQSSGSVSLPSYSFSGNTATGLFSPAVNQVALTTNGTAALSVIANGYVGIGTSSPTSTLQVSRADADPEIRLENTSSSTDHYPAMWVTNYAGTTNGQPAINMLNSRGTKAAPAPVQAGDPLAIWNVAGQWGSSSANYNWAAGVQVVADGNFTAANVAPASMIFKTGTTSANAFERMRINSLGNVGLGTGTPAAALDVTSVGSSSAIIVPRDIASNRPTGVNGMLRYNTSSNAFEGFANNVWSTIAAGSAAGTVTNIASGTGLLGGPITTSGTLSVDVGTAANKIVQENATAQIAQSAGSVALPAYSFAGNTNTGLFSPGSSQLALVTAGTAAVNISSVGYVGIGSASPAANLDIYNVTTANAGTSAALNVLNYVPNNKSFSEIDAGNFTVTTQQVGSANAINGVAGTVNNNSLGTVVSGGSFSVNNTVTYPSVVNGVLGKVSNYNGGSFNQMYGGSFNVTVNGGGATIAAATGVSGAVANPSGSTITNAYGLYSGITNSGGTVTNGYGLYISPVAGTNRWGIFENSGGLNYLAGALGIGTSLPQAGLDVALVGSASAIIVPRDTTGNRPNGVNGMIRYNTTNNGLEGYINGGWSAISAGSAAGTVTNIASGTGLLGGPITSSGTISVDVGTAANKIVQENASAQVAQSIGSAGLPSYSFAGNLNTGFYSPGTNQLALTTNGTAALTVASSGSVGIGTTAPAATLDIAAYASTALQVTSQFANPNANFQAGNGAAVYAASNSNYGVVAKSTSATGLYAISTSGYGLEAKSSTSSAGVFSVSAGTAPTLIVSQVLSGGNDLFQARDGSGNSLVRISATGFLGWGTAAPQAALDVAVTGSAASAIIVPRDTSGNRPSGVNGMLRYNTTTSAFEGFANNAWSTIAAGSAAGTVTNIASGTGLLGGPITSSGTLSVNVGTAANQIVQENSSAQIAQQAGSAALPSYSFAGSVNTGLYSPAANQVGLAVNGTAALTVLPSGFVGLGTTAPISLLQVNGNALVNGTLTVYSNIISTGTIYGGSSPSGGLLIDSTTSGTKGNILLASAGGNVGVGVAVPQAGLDIAVTGTSSAILIPRDTTGNRPTGVNGMLRYNTTLAALEGFVNGTWSTISSGTSSSSLSSIASGTGLLGGPITSSGTLSVDVGTAANKIVQENANAQIAQSLGSVALPTYSFAGNANTGLYSPGANQLALASNGSAALTIAAGGSVGIGSSSPLTRLQVSGGDIAIDTGRALRFDGAATGNWRMGLGLGSYTKSLASGNSIDITSSGNDFEGFTFGIGGLSGYELTGAPPYSIRHFMRGNVGINTNAPAAVLDIAAFGTSSSAVVIPRDTTANRPAGVNGMLRYNTTTSAFEGYQAGAWTNLIGGGSLSFPLLASPATTTAAAPSYSFSGNANTGLFSPATNQLALATNGTTAVTVLANGNVGVGTATAPSKLTVYDPTNNAGVTPLTVTAYTGAGPGKYVSLVIDNQTSGAYKSSLGFANNGAAKFALNADFQGAGVQNFSLYDNVAATTRFLVDPVGRFGIGTESPQGGLDVALTGSASSAIIVPRDTAANRPSPVNGMLRYNTDAQAMEAYVNGAWRQLATQAVGSVANVTANAPPVSANTYAPASTTCNYSPNAGSCTNITNGYWPANGTNVDGSASCVNINNNGTQAIVIDLGSIKTIGNIFASMRDETSFTNLMVSFSTDGTNYTTNTSIAPSTYTYAAKYVTSSLAPAQTARYIRLTNGSGNSTYDNRQMFCQFAVGP